jgi:hypothetical protein
MGQPRQFYDGLGVPLQIDREPEVVAVAWTSHRTRLRTWLNSVPDAQWSGPTRCELWDITGLVRHLVSGSQFLGYTLHRARGGTPTDLMRDYLARASEMYAGQVSRGTTTTTRRSLNAANTALDQRLGGTTGCP